jgi:NAD+ synthase
MHVRSTDLVAWLRTRVTSTGAEGLIVPLTDTLQTAVVTRLCQLAAANAVLGALQAAGADQRTQARTLAQQLQLPVVDVECYGAIPLASELEAQVERLRRKRPADLEEAPPDNAFSVRVSMAATHFVAESLRCLVVGTLDRTDLTLGTFTRYGESDVDLLPLGATLRNEVVALAQDLELPSSLLEQLRPADAAGLDVGLTHHDLERYVADGPDGVAPAVALKAERLMRESERKRAAAEIPDLASGLNRDLAL